MDVKKRSINICKEREETSDTKKTVIVSSNIYEEKNFENIEKAAITSSIEEKEETSDTKRTVIVSNIYEEKNFENTGKAAIISSIEEKEETSDTKRRSDISNNDNEKNYANTAKTIMTSGIYEKEESLKIDKLEKSISSNIKEKNTLGPYQFIELVGEGGMGKVYKAYDTRLDRIIALKIIRSQENTNHEAVQRFFTEARAIAKLVHPNIIRLYEIGEEEGILFFTMDFIEGQPFEELLKSGEKDLKKLIQIMEKVARAIDFAHKSGVVHRDIKPANIMLDKNNEPYVMDFGLAKIEGNSNITKSGMIMGTLTYMSPEQFEGNKDVGPCSDIYSLGAILYEILTKQPPAKGDSLAEFICQVLSKEPPLPTKINPDISEDIENICLKAIAKNKNLRYSSAFLFAEDLKKFISNKKITTTNLRTNKHPLKKYILRSIIFLTFITIVFFIISKIFLLPPKDRHIEDIKNKIQLSDKIKTNHNNSTKISVVSKKKNTAIINKKTLNTNKKIRHKEKDSIREKEISFILEVISENLSQENFVLVNKKIDYLSNKYPDTISKLKKYIRLEKNLKSIHKYMKLNDFKSALALMKNIRKDSRKIFDNIFSKYLSKGSLSLQKQIIVFGLENIKECDKQILMVIKSKNYNWIKRITFEVPADKIETFFKLINSDKTLKQKSDVLFAKYMLLYALQNIHMENSLQIIKKYSNSQLSEDIWNRLSFRQKNNIIKNLSKIAPSKKIFILLIKKFNREKQIQLLYNLLKKLGKIPTPISQKILIRFAQKSQLASLRWSALQSLSIHSKIKAFELGIKDESVTIRINTLQNLIPGESKHLQNILINSLPDENDKVSFLILQNLRRFKNKNVISLLGKLLLNKNISIAQVSAKILGEINTRDSFDELKTAIFEVTNSLVANSIIKNIGKHSSIETIQILFKILIEQHLWEKYAQQELINKGKESFPFLVDQLEKPLSRMAIKSILDTLQGIGSICIPKLCSALEQARGYYIKKMIIKTLGNIGNQQSIPILIKMLNDTRTKRYAQRALKSILSKLSPQSKDYKIIKKKLKTF